MTAQLRHNVQKGNPADAALSDAPLVEREKPGELVFEQSLRDAPRRFGGVELGAQIARRGVKALGRAVGAMKSLVLMPDFSTMS